MTYANGDIYDGSWQNGKKNGDGKYYYKSGCLFDGNWIDNHQNG